MVALLLKCFIGLGLLFGCIAIISLLVFFFTAAWESVKEDEANGKL